MRNTTFIERLTKNIVRNPQNAAAKSLGQETHPTNSRGLGRPKAQAGRLSSQQRVTMNGQRTLRTRIVTRRHTMARSRHDGQKME